MDTNDENHNLFHGDCIDLTSEPASQTATDSELALLSNANKPDPKTTFQTKQNKTDTPLKAKPTIGSNQKFALFGYSGTSRTLPRKETTPPLSKKNDLVILNGILPSPVGSHSPKKIKQPLNMGVSDIILTPSSAEIIKKKFPTSPTADDDEDVIFMSSRQLKKKPTQPLLPGAKPRQLIPVRVVHKELQTTPRYRIDPDSPTFLRKIGLVQDPTQLASKPISRPNLKPVSTITAQKSLQKVALTPLTAGKATVTQNPLVIPQLKAVGATTPQRKIATPPVSPKTILQKPGAIAQFKQWPQKPTTIPSAALKITPTQKLLANPQFKPATATTSQNRTKSLPQRPKTSFTKVTPLTQQAASASKSSSQAPKPVAAISKQSIPQLIHTLPKCLNEEKRLVRDIKLATGSPKLQKLNVPPITGKSREEILKALQEASASTLVSCHNVKELKMVENPFYRKTKVADKVARRKASNQEDDWQFSHVEVTKTYQRGVSGPVEYSHYVRSEDADIISSDQQENAQWRPNEPVGNVIHNQENSVVPTAEIFYESIQQDTSDVSSPPILKKIQKEPSKATSTQISANDLPNRLEYSHCIESEEVYSISSDFEQNIPQQIIIHNEFEAAMQTQCDSVQEYAPDTSLMIKSTALPQVTNIATNISSPVGIKQTRTTAYKANIISKKPAARSGNPPKAVLRNPLNGLIVRSNALQQYESALAEEMNLQDLAETASAVANINEEPPDGTKGNPLVFLLYPMVSDTGSPFKEGQIQQMVALVPSGSGFTTLPVVNSDNEDLSSLLSASGLMQNPVTNKEPEIGSKDFPLLPLVHSTRKTIPSPPGLVHFDETPRSTTFDEPPRTKILDKPPRSRTPDEPPRSNTPEVVEGTNDEIIVIHDDPDPEYVTRDIEIEAPGLVMPVDISSIINRFKKPAAPGRCSYYTSPRKKAAFKGFSTRERKYSSCHKEMKRILKKYKKMADNLKQEMLLKYRNIVYCNSNDNDFGDFLPETIKTEVKEEIEEYETVTIADDYEASNHDLPTIGEVISQVNREVLTMQQRRNTQQGEMPPQALELIKKGLEMIQNWSQKTGTSNQLESIIRDKLEEPIEDRVQKRKANEAAPRVPKRKAVTEETTKPVKRKPGRPKRAQGNKKTAILKIRAPVRKRGRRTANVDDNDLLLVKRVDIVKSNGKRRYTKKKIT